MAHGNLAFARHSFAEINSFNRSIETLLTIDAPLARLYGMRTKPTADGALGHNRNGYVNIAYQRYALDFIIYGITANHFPSIKHGVNGIRYGFGKQLSDGSFDVSFLSRRKTDIGDRLSKAALFLTSAAICYQLVHHCPFRRKFLKQLTEIRLGIRKTTYWLSKNDLTLFLHDQDSAYNLINDALAFIISGEIYNNVTLIKRGHIFLEIALELQRDDGAFIENEGHDSSYQSSSIVLLTYYMLFVKNRGYFNKALRAIITGTIWEKSRIMPNGKVNSRDNTRRFQSYSTFSGRKSDINYSEVIKGFLWYSFFTKDLQSHLLARQVFRFISRQAA